jgi:nitrogen-specific signal transduction histidine kinase
MSKSPCATPDPVCHADIIGTVFAPFVHDGKANGLGIGLTIARTIVDITWRHRRRA